MNRILAGSLVAAIALVVGTAQAQTGTASSATSTENRPAETGIDQTNGSKPKSLERAENSRPAKATKRAAKKGTNVAKKAGHKTADAMRSTGKGIETRLPKGGTNASGASNAEMGNTQPAPTQPQR